MNLFAKKETLVENIAFFAIMASLNIIFVVITAFIPIILFALILFLTFSSAFVSLLCKKKYFPIYLIATVAICCLIDLSDTIFFIVPSMISGFIFAFLYEKKISTSILFLINTFVLMGFTYVSFIILDAIFNVTIVDTMFFIFDITEFQYKDFIVAPVIFLTSLGQVVISYIIIDNEMPKLGFESRDVDSFIVNCAVIIASLLFMILSAFVFPKLCYLFLIIAVWFSINLIIYLIRTKKILNIVFLIILLILTPFIIAIFNPIIPKPFHLLTISFDTLLILLISIVNYYLLKIPAEYKIN